MKKLLCIALTIALAAIMMLNTAAATIVVTPPLGPASSTTSGVVTSGIKGINESDDIDNLADFTVTVNDDKRNTLSLDDLSDLEVAPGDVIKIPLSGVLFLDSSGNPFSQGNVSLSALNSAAITVRTSFSRGQGTFTASLGGNKNGSYIKLEFAEGIILNPQRFSASIFLAKNGARKGSTRIAIAGEMQTVSQELNSGDDYADISDGSFVTAKTMLRNVELYLGNYCTITRTLLRGQTYAGIADIDDINGEDMVVLNKYPAIEYIYKLKTVGLKTSGNIVTFDLDRKYYVYNAHGAYIGMSNQALPYWTKYYLSDKKYASLVIKITK